MGLFEPSNIYPSTWGGVGNGTIDVSDNLTVTWQVNGNVPMTAFSIQIYNNDSTGALVYETGRLTNGCPFDGVDYAGNVQFFAYTIPSATMTGAGMANGKAYKLKITQYWNALSAITQSSATVFNTRAKPVVSILNLGSQITTRDFYFLGSYTQAQGDALMWCRWRLATADNLANPIVDTHNIYGTSNLRLDYDGFFTGTTYAVRLEIQTENGIQADTGWKTFTVNYASSDISGYVDVSQVRGTGALLVSWAKLLVMQGVPRGDYTIAREQLTLNSGSSVTWDTMNGGTMSFAWPWSIGWKGSAEAGTTPLTVTGDGYTLTFHVEQDGFYIKVNGKTVYSLAETYKKTNWWTVALTPGTVYILLSKLVGGLYPEETLYPKTTLYPKPEYYASPAAVSGSISIPEFAINSVALAGQQTCEYIWITAGTLSDATIRQMMTNTTFEPEQDGSTYFLCDFKNGLLAGNLPEIGDNVTGYSVYRRERGESYLEHVGNFPLTVSQFLDYSARSQTEYVYTMRALGESTFATQPLVSTPIKGRFWSWGVLEAEKESDGLLHVLREFRFRLNLNSGSVSNNNSPDAMQNFTPYPTVQPAAANYQSGTLSALAGVIAYDGGRPEYINTRKMREAITALSTTTHTILLKTPIGDIFPIRTGGAVTVQTKDATKEQVMTVSIPWVQIGAEPEAGVVSVPTDDFWPVGKAQEVDA